MRVNAYVSKMAREAAIGRTRSIIFKSEKGQRVLKECHEVMNVVRSGMSLKAVLDKYAAELKITVSDLTELLRRIKPKTQVMA